MTPTRSTTPGPGLASTVAMALMALAISACTDSGNEEVASAEGASPTATQPESEAARPAADDEPQVIGEVVIDGQSHSLTKAHWCEPEDGFESGTTVAIRVAATDESGDVTVYGIRVDDDDGDSTLRVMAATDPNTNYKSEGLGREPTILMEDGSVRLQGLVYRPGHDPVEVEAEFSLPAEPGFPGYC